MPVPLILLIALLYLSISVMITVRSSRKKIGRVKTFILSMFCTPVAGIIAYKLSSPVNILHIRRYHCTTCHLEFTEPIGECPYCKKEGRNSRIRPVKITCI